jgi:hypothetical protein
MGNPVYVDNFDIKSWRPEGIGLPLVSKRFTRGWINAHEGRPGRIYDANNLEIIIVDDDLWRYPKVEEVE